MKDDLSYRVDNENPEKKKRVIRGMFDSIVPTYDLLNRLLSGGIDRIWRKRLVRMAGDVKGKPVLDLCCGTGDLSRLFMKEGASLVSLDFSLEMLRRGREKKWLPESLVAADASRLPFVSGTFHRQSIAFGIRNIPDVDRFLSETRRTLGPGGELLILELTRPTSLPVRILYNVYLKYILPLAGGIISGKPKAYRYLAGTISTFLDPENIARRARNAGFSEARVRPLTLGVATIIQCRV
jgi:demethylmenaquinone methyltransferase/2-methoxy-6-polyprenyl-1,4-benzoquinol methylase